MEARERLYRDRCDSPKYWPDSVKHYINSYGQNKVIFGTDFPVLLKRTVDEVDEFGLKPEVRRKFMRDNAIRVYGLEDLS